MRYKNLGITSRTFYGIEIKPGEVKDFPGFVNAPRCIRVNDNVPLTDETKSPQKSITPIQSTDIPQDKTEDKKLEAKEAKQVDKELTKSNKSSSSSKTDESKESGK